MAANDCIDAIKRATGEDLTDKQLDEILTLLDRRSKRAMKDDPSLSREAAFARAAEDLAAEKKLAALIEKRNRAINVIRRAAIIDRLDASPTAADGLRALVYGVEGNFYGAGLSTDAQFYALRQSMRGALVNDLKEAGVLEVARRSNPDLEAQVAREMSRLNGNTSIAPAASEMVAKLAGILQRHTEAARLVQNDAGAYIRKMPGYVTRQSHDQLKIDRAGYEAWRDTIAPLLDERAFDDVDDRESFLRAVYTNLAAGNHLKAGGDSDFLGGFKGPGNLAKRASAERVLHFQGPDEWMRYNAQFGRASLFESVLDAIDYGARNTALMRVWGTNPEAMFGAVRDRAILRAKDAGASSKEIQAISGGDIQRAFNDLTAAVDVPGNVRLAQIGSGIRLVQAMAKLGGMVLSSIPDLGVRAATLRHNGVGVGERWFRVVGDMFSHLNGSERRQVADLMGAGIDGLTGDVFRQMSSLDTTPGRLAKVADKFFKLTGQTWWQDAHTRGTAIVLAKNLADSVSAPLAQLEPRLQTTLRRYGIGDTEWTALGSLDARTADGQRFLTPDLARELDDEATLALLGKEEATPRELNAARRDLEGKLQAYIHDQIREAMTVAGARERAMLTGYAGGGTLAGEALRLLMQFKTYPTTFIRRSLNREFNRDGIDYAGVGQLIASTTLLGMVSLALKDIVKGREPRWPDDPVEQAKLWAAAAKQGGGLGIYGDFLLGEANRVGGGWANTLLGPTFGGTLGDVERVLNAARRGYDPRAAMLRAGLNNTPFANLFYARWAMDYTFLYALQDSVDPGSVRRMQRQIERDKKQTFYLPPTSYTGSPARNLEQLGRDLARP
jgi:hypothetical protein